MAILLGSKNERQQSSFGFLKTSLSIEAADIAHQEGHIMTVAPTGTGKGVSCIIPALLSYTGQTIVIDPKGENYAVTAACRRRMGHQVICLDPFGITKHPTKDALTPFALFTGDKDKDVDIASQITSFMAVPTDSNNRFWDLRGNQLITALILFIYWEAVKEYKSLSEVHHALNCELSEFEEVVYQIQRSSNKILKTLASAYHCSGNNTSLSILSTAQASIEYLRGPNIHECTKATSFDVPYFIEGKPMTIYLVIPPDKLDSHGSLLRLWVGTLIALILRRQFRVKQPTLFLLDEAAQLGKLDILRQAITLLRGYGVMVWTFWQDLNQLMELYGKDWRTIYNNCSVHQFFGVRTAMAANTISEVTGFVTPEYLLQMGSDEMWFSQAGKIPEIVTRVNYLTSAQLKEKASPNPFYLPPRKIKKEADRNKFADRPEEIQHVW